MTKVLNPTILSMTTSQKEKAVMPAVTSSGVIIPPQPQLLRPPNRNFQSVHGRIEGDPQYCYMASGAYRRVYKIKNEKFVLKIPHGHHGERDNIIEALLYAHDPFRRAWCELVEYQDIWALRMECVDEVRNGMYPAWVHQLSGDGPQCGTRQNPLQTLVVYDYAFVWNNEHLKKQFQWLLDHYGRF